MRTNRFSPVIALAATVAVACGGRAPFGADAGADAGPGTDTDTGGTDMSCPEVGAAVFETGVLHEIRLTVSEENWQALVDEAEAYSEDESIPQTYVEASIAYDELPALDGVGIRIKGNHSVQNAVYLGKSLPLKVDLNRFAPGQDLDGLKKLNLHAVVDEDGGWEWPSDPVADYVSYTAMRAHGAGTSRVVFAEVFVNGASQGLYSVVEQVTGGFVKCNYTGPHGALYKPGESLEHEGDAIEDYPHHGLKWPDECDHQSFLDFVKVLDSGTDAELEQALDIDGALAYFAFNIGLGNWDYYTFITHNYYLYEVEPGRFTLIPWDMNMSQVGWDEPCGVGAGEEDTPLSRRLLTNPTYVARYVELLRAFLEGAGSAGSQHATVDAIEPLIGQWITGDRLDDLRANITARTSGLIDALDGLEVCPEWTDWE